MNAELHKHQLDKIKLQNKNDELRKKLAQTDTEYGKLRQKLKEAKLPEKRLLVTLSD